MITSSIRLGTHGSLVSSRSSSAYRRDWLRTQIPRGRQALVLNLVNGDDQWLDVNGDSGDEFSKGAGLDLLARRLGYGQSTVWEAGNRQ